ncbi:MAG: hypothetical protein NZ959_07465 [Armatimonadetes bacterium]|nr:hypothetical protein [Armatimonadota bacterium]MDW8122223.1 hypothetical protein [Armatimonadota bacterium]
MGKSLSEIIHDAIHHLLGIRTPPLRRICGGKRQQKLLAVNLVRTKRLWRRHTDKASL